MVVLFLPYQDTPKAWERSSSASRSAWNGPSRKSRPGERDKVARTFEIVRKISTRADAL